MKLYATCGPNSDLSNPTNIYMSADTDGSFLEVLVRAYNATAPLTYNSTGPSSPVLLDSVPISGTSISGDSGSFDAFVRPSFFPTTGATYHTLDGSFLIQSDGGFGCQAQASVSFS
ncbi:MAG TPA: hypothetical protein VGH79_07810 [Gaiellaceae bacterium]